MHNQLVIIFPIQYFSANHTKRSTTVIHRSCSDLEGVRFDDHYLSHAPFAQSRMRIRVNWYCTLLSNVFIMQGGHQLRSYRNM